MKSILGIAHDPAGISDVNSIGFSISGEGVNTFESDKKGNPADPDIGDIMVKFGVRNDAFVTNIQNALNIALPKTTLSSLSVVDRIRTQTCAGCHQFSDHSNDPIGLGGGAVWPNKRAGDATHPKMPFTQEF